MPAKPTNRALSKHTRETYVMPREKDGTPARWVVEMARLRAAGVGSVRMIAKRVGMSWVRCYHVMNDPDYRALEIVECLRMLELRRPRAIAALGDRAESGDPAAVRLLCELTGVVEPTRPLLVSVTNVTGVAVNVTPAPARASSEDPHELAAQRDSFFTKLLKEPPIDVIFRSTTNKGESNGTNGTNGKH